VTLSSEGTKGLKDPSGLISDTFLKEDAPKVNNGGFAWSLFVFFSSNAGAVSFVWDGGAKENPEDAGLAAEVSISVFPTVLLFSPKEKELFESKPPTVANGFTLVIL